MNQPASNVVQLQTHTVPLDVYEQLHKQLEEMTVELAAARRHSAADHRQIKALRNEINDLLDEAADGPVVKKALEYWKGYFVAATGREPKTVKIPLSGARARHARWVIAHFGKDEAGARAFCLAVRGLFASDWFVRRQLCDVKHLCMSGGRYDEAKVEGFIEQGRMRGEGRG